MAIRLNPYLSFRGEARQAMEFYKSVFGGNLHLSTFGEAMPGAGPDDNDKIMHAELTGDNGVYFMASDAPDSMPFQPGANIRTSLSGDSEAELRSYFDKLAVGGTVEMPLVQAPWGDTFGMLVDKYGVGWMVNITPAKA